MMSHDGHVLLVHLPTYSRTQFAEINAPILSWDFEIKDTNNLTLGLITRRWTQLLTEVESSWICYY